MSVAAVEEGLDVKLARVRRLLQTYPSAVIAFSGGVDSTLLTKLARQVLGRARVLAATADSPSLAREDLSEAIRLARELDVPHRVVATDELQLAEYQANSGSRCYWCKHTLFVELEALARQEGYAAILYGAIGEDLASERPGQTAAAQRGARAPLQEAGLSKAEVRQAAKALGLSNWDRPQNACLASRIPHGLEVTAEKLRQVEQAEALLRAEGFRQVRVRHLGARARIEVEAEAVGRFKEPALRRRVLEALQQLGFTSIGVDPRGYQSGGADAEAVKEWILQADEALV